MVTNLSIALGTVQWGLEYGVANRRGVPPLKEIAKMLRMAADAGVWTLDTARAYGDSERIIGQCTLGDPRWRIITKITPDLPNDVELLAKCILDSIEQSRTLLRVKQLDTVLLHRAEHKTVAGGVCWETLLNAVRQGLVGRAGISAQNPKEAMAALEDPDVRCLQVATSLFDQRLIQRQFFDMAAEHKVEVFLRSVFLQGAALMDPETLPENLNQLRPILYSLRRWCDLHQRSLYEVLVRFAHQNTKGTPVIGCESYEQLRANLTILGSEPLKDENIEELKAIIPDLTERTLNPALWSV